MKLGQILVCCMRQTFLTCFWLIAGYWELVTSQFMILLKWQYCKIWPFLNVLYSSFQKNETLKFWHSWLLSNRSRLLNWIGPETYPQSSKLFSWPLKIIALVYIYQLLKYSYLMSFGSTDIFKNTPCLMY